MAEARTGYGRGRPVEIAADHFEGELGADRARALLASSLRKVQIEIYSYCNRRCGYCPVSQVDRRTSNNHMPVEMFEKAIGELAGFDYSGDINFTLFNEPLADRIVLERLAAVRAALPRAFIYLNTNGDYLDADYLDELERAGVNQITVTLHAAPGATYDDEGMERRFAIFRRRTGLVLTLREQQPGLARREDGHHGELEVIVWARNFSIVGVDRAGLVEMPERRVRQAPCDRPFGELAISYDGTVLPCCQFFADSDEHLEHKVGSLADSSLAELFASATMATWRRGLLTYGPKGGPCATCADGDIDGTPEQIAERERLQIELVASR